MASIFDSVDFRGGYCTDVPDHLMAQNELLAAVNVEWDNGLQKRKGTARYAAITASSILGYKRVMFGSTWISIIPVKTAAGATEFHYGTTAGVGFSATLPYPSNTAHSLTGTGQIRMAVLNEQVVCVNGTDKPRVVYALPSATLVMDTLDHYDRRDRQDLNWSAGQYDILATYTDDTSNAQSSASVDFKIGQVPSSGFFIGCDHRFNKVVIKDIGATQSASMGFEYWGYATSGALTETWNALTPLSTVTFSVTGDKTVEWNALIGQDGQLLPTPIASNLSVLSGKYAVRGYLLSSFVATAMAQGLSCHHTQYVTELFIGDTPSKVAEHKNHLFLAASNWLRTSPADALTGWRSEEYHWFQSGGTIQSMISHDDYILILLDDHRYGIAGNAWDSFNLVDLQPGGAVAPDGTIVVGSKVFFVGRDGIWMWDGSNAVKVSKHIQTDIDSLTLTDAQGIYYQDKCLLSFPTNKTVLMWDPDTFRVTEDGDGRVGFFKWLNYEARYWSWDKGATDTGYLLAAVNAVGPHLQQCETGQTDFYASATQYTDGYAQSPHNAFNQFMGRNQVRRLKARVSEVSVTGCSTFIVSFFSRANGTAASSTVSFSTAIGTSTHEEDLTVPYAMDGTGVSWKIRHKSSATAKFFGIAMDVRPRGF